MNTNQLRYFVSVATYKSFTKAAETHFLSQTAITQQIKALEDSLGLQLVDRQKRPIELTPAGHVFFQEAKSILSKMDEAIAKTQEASTGLTGTLRIGYEKGFERSDLSDRLREFHRAYPNILISCFRDDTDTLAAKMQNNDLDVIFAWDSTNARQNEDIDSVLMVRSPLVAAMYSSHPLAGRKSVKRELLQHEDFLFMTPSRTGDSVADARFLQLYEKAGYTPHILLKSNDIESLLMMVAAEQGVCILPSYSVSKLDNADNLSFVPMDGEEEYEDIYMLWKKSNSNPALQYFMGMPGIGKQADREA